MKNLFPSITRTFVLQIILVMTTTLLTVACNLAQGTPTISPGLVATTVALTMQAQVPLASPTSQTAATALPPTATAVLATTTATALPTPTATSSLPGGERVDFATGATAGIARGQVQHGGVQNFLVGAAAGQPLIISVDSPNHDVTFSVSGRRDGAVLLSASQKLSSWQSLLATTQDYLIQVYGGAGTENFTLNVIIPARITFDPGAISAQRSGSTPGGLIVSYILRANAGQKMKLQLAAPDGNAVLAMYGFQDGQPYLRYVVESTTFDMVLPASEDYIIQVYPRAGAMASYTLNIEVK
jgi:hypothetical protein